MTTLQKISPCLWFDGLAEEAANYYVEIFQDAKITAISYFGKAGFEVHGRPEGSVLTVEVQLAGQAFTFLNGGPQFKFSEAVSFQINCETQHEIDYYWERLTAGGPLEAQQCGWLKDRFGVSWQVVPTELATLMSDPDSRRTEAVMTALLSMHKLDLARLRNAFNAV
ncbi:MAG: VOC family protein [Pseudomonas sp.]|nr:VOC family protein [Pseudomonas sp.]